VPYSISIPTHHPYKGVPSDFIKTKMAVIEEMGFFSNRHLMGFDGLVTI
jgi:hypothetical protein